MEPTSDGIPHLNRLGIERGIQVARVPHGRSQYTLLADGYDGLNAWVQGFYPAHREVVVDIAVPGNPKQGKNGNYWYSVRLTANDLRKLADYAEKRQRELDARLTNWRRKPPTSVGRQKP